MGLSLFPLNNFSTKLNAEKGLVYQRLFWGTLAGCIIALLWSESPLLETLELQTLKLRYQMSNKLSLAHQKSPISKDIALVVLDDTSQFDLGIAHFNDDRSQNMLAEIVETVEKEKPAVIGIDLDLRGAAQPRLVRQLTRNKNIVLSLFGSLDENADLPSPDLVSHASAYGYNELYRELNGLVVRLPVGQQEAESSRIDSVPIQSFVEAVMSVYRRIKGVGPVNWAIRHVADQQVYIDFSQTKFPVVSFEKVLNGEFDPNSIRDKIVLVGSLLTSKRGDLLHYKTPLSDSLSEVVVQANAISTLLNNKMLYSLPKQAAKDLLLLCAAVFGALFSYLSFGKRLTLVLCSVGAYCVLSQLSFQFANLILPVMSPLAVLLSDFFIGTVIFLDTDLRKSNNELAQARQSMQERAEQERQRIAEDLHDETLPALAAVARMADHLLQEQKSDIPQQMRQKLDSTVVEMRRVINDLHPSVLETMGFFPALDNLLGILAKETGVKTKFENKLNESDIDLSHFTKLQLYRMVQEALNNVQKHSKATEIQLNIRKDRTDLQINVIDNGVGFDPNKIRPEAHGLLNIKQRAQLIGAKVEWRNPRQFISGTEFVLKLPLIAKEI